MQQKPCYQCKGFCCEENRTTTKKSKRCEDCNRMFFDDACFQSHKREDASWFLKKPICDVVKSCPVCHCDLRQKKNGDLINYGNRRPHQCFKTFCTTCKESVEKYFHQCFLSPINKEKLKQKQKERCFLFFFISKPERKWMVP